MHRQAHGFRNRKGRFLNLAIVALLLLGSLSPFIARAEEGPNEEGDKLTPLPTSINAPRTDLLSSIAAAAVLGLDPRWVGNLPPGVSFPMAEQGVYAAAAGSAANGTTSTNQQVPFRNPAPGFSRNLIVTRAVGNYPTSTEPHIAVDPTDPDHLVLGVIDFNLASIGIYVSFDGGETWDGPKQPRYFREDVAVGGDPVIAFDRDGNVYAALLSIGVEEFRLGTIQSYQTVSSLVVAKSTDGGVTWEDGISATRSRVQTISNVDSEGKERGIIRAGFLDKEWMSIGPDPDNPDQDIIYLTYTDFESSSTLLYADEVPFLTPISTETTIRVVSSRDGGATWSQPVQVSPTALFSESYSEEGEGTQSATAANIPGSQGGFGMLTVPQGEPVLAQDDDGGSAQTEQEGEGGIVPRRFVQGSQPKVLSDGTVVVAWFDSTDDGPS
jgi:hypothetical protein